jgi:predicted nucleotidyltransferase
MISLKSDITIKVLGYYFINPQARHYVRELSDLLKVDSGNLSKKMAELKKEGLFLMESEGKNRYFILNKKFPLLNEYRKIYEARFGVAESIRKELSEISGLKEAYIFGSFARGNFEAGSDIDLLVIGDHEHAQISRRISSLEKRWHREINIIDFSIKEFIQKQKNKDPFLKNIFSGKLIRIK